MTLSKNEKWFICLLILYIIIYGAIFFSKYFLWGSDILNIISKSQHINFKSLYDKDGFPLGLPILLQLETKLSGYNIYSVARLHTLIIFVIIIFLTYITSLKLIRSHKAAILSSFIVVSVYPSALLMSIQFGQEVNLAIILFFSLLLSLTIMEKIKNKKFGFISIFFILSIFIVHRSSSIILVSIIIFYMLTLFISSKKSKSKKNFARQSISIGISIVILIFLFSFLIYLFPFIEFKAIISKLIRLDTIYYANSPISITRGYFMNYVGWETIPSFAVSLLLLINKIKYLKIFPKIYLSSLFVILVFVSLYIMGISIIVPTIMWRAADYSLFFIAISVSFVLIRLYKILDKNKLSLYYLYGLASISLLFYPLDPPIQRYIQRAVSGTLPTRVTFPIISNGYILYIIYGFILIVILLLGIMLIIHKRSFNKKKIFSEKFIFFIILFILLAPRIAMGITGFYIRPPDITYQQYTAFVYIKANYPNEKLISDPSTLGWAVLFGLHTQFLIGSHVYTDTFPPYGPIPGGGYRVSNIAIFLDTLFKNKDIDSLYKFMKNSNNSLLIINVYGGKLVNMNINPPCGGYSNMPQILIDFKNALEKSGKFQLIYSQNYGDEIYVYKIVG
ncbi:hypothetical protein [Candidatus Aciduliprofundum boonei]|uniref:Uncharacterized protein n=1 Tax=Aciduliprofundum boonei (strain DSM 19572 / T469) TaxID=439481 RepID=B5IDI5_ACIB4|nr:hypothetical protein [Candidatus Aciduliprofundum boonei]ADD08060.1 hypothetical protein Aboo_0248 [Aciduliprofundum boonei T469]EDY35548.1 hypothetical protein ABOONEI_85 [Aciduliprofundum boonei T469]